MQELIKKWREFEEASKESLRIKYMIDDPTPEVPKYFKADFSDFINWLENLPKQ